MSKTLKEQLSKVAPSLGFDVKKTESYSKQTNPRHNLTLAKQLKRGVEKISLENLTSKGDVMSLDLKLGDRVEHRRFGQGIIVRLCPNAQGIIADVKFAHATEYVDSRSLKCSRIEDIRHKIKSESRRKADAAKKEQEKKICEKEERRKQEIRRQQKIELERKRAEELSKTRKQALITKLQNIFESDFLSADQLYKTDPDSTLINEREFEEAKTNFVRKWAVDTLGIKLDEEQAAAVAAVHGDIKVTARAGSGKTRTLVTRSIFLQKHCRIAPHEILLLAFNTAAANKVKEDLSKFLKGNLPHVLNFHKLAYALVRPKEELIYDDDNVNQFSLSREIQEIIDSRRMSNEYGSRIKDIMLEHFRHDWERMENGGFHLTIDELLAYRRQLPRETLKGDYVKSFGEKLIANILFENDIDYHYERYFPGKNIDFDFRPDFTIPHKDKNGGVIVEYFGIQGDKDYDELADRKRELMTKQSSWAFLEFIPTDITKDGEKEFAKIVIEKLYKAGISSTPLSETEIWERVKRRAIDGFTKAMRQFISRCRKLNLNPDKLKALVNAHTPCSNAENFFLEIGLSVYKDYQDILTKKRKEDFDGIMWRAVTRLHNNETNFERDKGQERGNLKDLRFIMIDEFQDFSIMFFEMMKAIRVVNPNVQFFCVGDDWQAINAFAGSDLDYFENFDQYFNNCSQQNIRTNYRSPRGVVSAGNALMNGLGVPAQASPDRKDYGWLKICKINEFIPTAPEHALHNGDKRTPALLRLIRHLLERGDSKVVMLSRRSSAPWPIKYTDTELQEADEQERFRSRLCSYFPEEDRERITISTTHRYKGREREAVIILDATGSNYPLIHPHWFFLRIFKDSIDKIEREERRLFYVAVTRAMNSLALITDAQTQSPYLSHMNSHHPIETLRWDDLPPVPSLESPRLEIRVLNKHTYDIRDQLKDRKFKWNDPKRYWHKSVMSEGFSFDLLIKQPWANSGVKIQVYTESLELLYER